MRLRYMELRNYRKFREAKVEFPDGVVAIVGQNGTGKTTLLEAVTWALFGNESSVVRDGKDGVISAGAPPGEECHVLLEFDLGGDAYRLARSMKGTGLRVDAFLEVNGEVIAKGDKAVTDAVSNRLGMDHKGFFVSVFAKQKDLNALANLRPADRKKLVLRMLGVDFLNDVVTDIDRDAGTAKKEAEQLSLLLRDQQGADKELALRSRLKEGGTALERLSSEKVTLAAEQGRARAAAAAAREAWEREEERYRADVALERRLTGLRAGLQGRHERLARLEAEIAELERLKGTLPALLPVEEEHRSCAAENERLGLLKERHQQRQRTQDDLAREKERARALEEEVVRTSSELAELADPEARLVTVEESLEEAREGTSATRSHIRLAEADMARTKALLKESEERASEIAALGEDSNCPTCLRRMGEQYTDLLRRYGDERAGLQGTLDGLEGSLRDLAEQLAKGEARTRALEKRRNDLLEQGRRRASLMERERRARETLRESGERAAALEALLTSMGGDAYDAGAHETVRKRLRELEERHRALERTRTKLERAPLAKGERDAETAAIQGEEETLRAASAERKELAFQMRALQERRAEHEGARAKEEGLAKDLIRAEGEAGRLEMEMRGLQDRLRELEDIRSRHAALKEEQELLNRLGQAMKGFKENVISRIVPTLSSASSDLLTHLTDGKYGGMRLDDEYQMYIYDQGEEHALERFSGGESDLANLCLRLAISRMIMERSGSQMNFLVLDEIFGSQDQSRKRNILETLAQLQKQFRQILLITHIDDVKDNVGAVLKVTEKEDGSSTVALEG